MDRAWCLVLFDRRQPLLIILLALLTSACGRFGFDPEDVRADGPGDSAGDADDACPSCACIAGELRNVTGTCVPAIVTDPSLVAYWPFDEAAGATAFRDLSPNANDGSCSPCPVAGTPGVRGTAIEFANAHDSIGVGTGPSLSGLSQGLTVSAWVKLRSQAQYGLVISNDRDCGGCGNYAGFSLWASGYYGGVALNLRDGGQTPQNISAPDPLPLNEWHFTTGTFDGAQMRVYVDGQLASQYGTVQLASPPSFETRIGALGFAPDLGIDAAVDEVMVFSRPLDTAEIAALYAYYVALPGGP